MHRTTARHDTSERLGAGHADGGQRRLGRRGRINPGSQICVEYIVVAFIAPLTPAFETLAGSGAVHSIQPDRNR